VLTAVVGLPLLRWRLPDASWSERAALAVTAALSVLAYRLAANMPQLNDDGVPGFSANDFLCPVVTYTLATVYAAFRPPSDALRWPQARALLTVASFVTNVVAI
jgi:hypothetical protein